MSNLENSDPDTTPWRVEKNPVETNQIDQCLEDNPNIRFRASLLSTGADREYHLANHPINQRPVAILTNAIKGAFLVVSDAVRFKRLGCSFLADFRTGKSTALEMIARDLRDVLPEVAYELVTAMTHDAVTERIFWGDIAVAFGLSLPRSAHERQQLLRAAIITACKEAGGRSFCLFVDEGQNWGVREYTFLRDFTNKLLLEDRYTVTTVIFGDLRLKTLASKFRADRKDLWARFLMKQELFECMSSVDDFLFFFSEYDSIKRCQYPAGTGLSYSEFYLPIAYASGWRLGGEAQNAWDAFVRAAASVNKKVTGIGMQWVGDAVNQFLTAKMSADVAFFKSSSDDWNEAIYQSKYIDSLL